VARRVDGSGPDPGPALTGRAAENATAALLSTSEFVPATE
jgi:hypothetical protein